MRDDKSWIQSAGGRQLWPLDCKPEDLYLEDIAASLAKLCRFNGHCNQFYSVAQHSVLASHVIAKEHAAWGLMHDAAESLIGDLPRPTKRQMKVSVAWFSDNDMYYATMKELEHQILKCMERRFNLPTLDEATEKSIERADLILLRTERRDLMAPPPRPWTTDEFANPSDEKIFGWSWKIAETAFLQRANELGIGAKK